MKLRIITGLILILILAPLIAIEILFVEILFQVVMGVFVGAAALELLKMFEAEKKYSIVIKSIIVFCALLLYGSVILMIYTSEDSYNFAPVLSALLINLIILLTTSVFADFDGRDVIKGSFSMLYAGIGISALVLLKNINVDFIIYLFLITSMTDIFAYFGGVCFGKHKMAPTISPKKTWEGAIIGSICGTAAASSFALFLGINNASIFSEVLSFDGALLIVFVIAITAIATVLGQIGDLVASKLKRTYEIKDFGNIFPGHGGVLDRFDSAIFVSMFLLAAIILLV